VGIYYIINGKSMRLFRLDVYDQLGTPSLISTDDSKHVQTLHNNTTAKKDEICGNFVGTFVLLNVV